MAYVLNPSNDEDKENSILLTGVPDAKTGINYQANTAAGNDNPSAVTNYGVSSDVLQGTSSTNPTATNGVSAAPTSSTPHSSGLFTNLNSYLNANQSGGQDLSNKISQNISDKNTMAQNAIDTSSNLFNTKVSDNTVNLDQNTVNNAINDSANFIKDQSNVANFAKMRDASYTGPSSFQTDTTYNPAVQNIVNAQEYGQQVGTTAGRQNLIRDLNPVDNTQTLGNLSLNNFLVQSDANALGKLNDTNSKLSALNSLLSNTTNTNNANVQNAINTTNTTKTAVNNALTNAFDTFKTNLNSKVSDLQNQATANNKTLTDLLSSYVTPASTTDIQRNKLYSATTGTPANVNTGLNDAQLSELGITRDQYNNLNNLITQYNQYSNPTNDLAVLGAMNLGGNNANTSSSTPTISQPSGLDAFVTPSNIGSGVGAIAGSFLPIPGGSVIGGILGNLIGGLFGGRPSVGPNANANILVSNGKLVAGNAGADNGGDANAVANVAAQSVSQINNLLDKYGLKVNDNAAFHKRTGDGAPIGLGIYSGNAGGDHVGLPTSAAGVWKMLLDNNAIVTKDGKPYNPAADLSKYLTASVPSTAITAANTASAEDYAKFNALNQLANSNDQYLTQNNLSQANTAKPDVTSFDYATAIKNLQQAVNDYQSNSTANKQAALNILSSGLLR